jgi:hypothetical protein
MSWRSVVRTRRFTFALLWVAFSLSCVARHVGHEIPRPEDVFGFAPGTDYELANYEQIYTYFHELAEASPRVIVEEIGTTVEGRPMILALISREENLVNRERYREISRRLALAEDVSEQEARELARKGKVILWIDSGLHSTEVAHAQHAPELAYWLASDESEEARRIRDEVILLLMPVMNPDGQEIVTSWYARNLGTEHELSNLPEIYHRYIGHDNNRDWYAFTQPETQAVAKILYHTWFPQIVYNHHQTGPFPGRIFVPPALGPINPHVDPLVSGKYSHIGQAMVQRFMAEGKAGVTTGFSYNTGWFGGFMHSAPKLHNMLGIFTETQLHGYATPGCYELAVLPDTFHRGRSVGVSTKHASPNYPNPWLGGCWPLREPVEYMLTASRAVLDMASRMRDVYLADAYLLGRRQIERGQASEGGPFAYILDLHDQHDPNNAVEMLRAFRRAGIQIHRAGETFRAGGEEYQAGTYVIPPQAFRPFVLDHMEPKEYPDRDLWPGGPKEDPQDMVGYEMALTMGVHFDRITEAFPMPGPLVAEVEIPYPQGTVTGTGNYGFLLSPNRNHSAIALNRLLAAGAEASWLLAPVQMEGQSWPPGTALVRGVAHAVLDGLARELGLEFQAIDRKPGGVTQRLSRPRVGLYKSYRFDREGAMDEGWLRWVLDIHEFDVEHLYNDDIRSGDLDEFDVIVISDHSARGLLEGHPPGSMPSEYVGGLGSEGGNQLKRFVKGGGWLVTFHTATEFVTSQFDLPVGNRVEGLSQRDFYVPGSLLRLRIDPTSPLGYGMPDEAVAAFWRTRTVPVVDQAGAPAAAEIAAHYPASGVLASGWAVGSDRYLGGQPAVMRLPVGRGQVVLMGFRPHFRGQSRAVFKLLFNPLFASTIAEAAGEERGVEQPGSVDP